jgi:hypothetical protein
MVLEQNSITGQPRPRTVCTSARFTVLGVALMLCAACAAAGIAASSTAMSATLRMARILPRGQYITVW